LKLDIYTGTAGIAFHLCKLRSESRTLAGIDELNRHMTVFTETEERAFRSEE